MEGSYHSTIFHCFNHNYNAFDKFFFFFFFFGVDGIVQLYDSSEKGMIEMGTRKSNRPNQPTKTKRPFKRSK